MSVGGGSSRALRAGMIAGRATVIALVALVAGNASAAPAPADEDPAVTPYRPSVSTPAAVPAPGWLELEVGGLQAHGPGDARRTSVPTTLKLGVAKDIAFVVGTESWVRASGGGTRASGAGDTSFTLKQRFGIDDAQAFGLETGLSVPTGSVDTGGADAVDATVNAIYSADFADAWHVDLNAAATRLGGSTSQSPGWRQGWAVALSRSLGDSAGGVAELSGTHQADTAPTTQILLAGSWNVSHALVLDAGAAWGLDRAAPRLQFMAGATMRLGRLF